jgi:hypothetical protein
MLLNFQCYAAAAAEQTRVLGQSFGVEEDGGKDSARDSFNSVSAKAAMGAEAISRSHSADFATLDKHQREEEVQILMNQNHGRVLCSLSTSGICQKDAGSNHEFSLPTSSIHREGSTVEACTDNFGGDDDTKFRLHSAQSLADAVVRPNDLIVPEPNVRLHHHQLPLPNAITIPVRRSSETNPPAMAASLKRSPTGSRVVPMVVKGIQIPSLRSAAQSSGFVLGGLDSASAAGITATAAREDSKMQPSRLNFIGTKRRSQPPVNMPADDNEDDDDDVAELRSHSLSNLVSIMPQMRLEDVIAYTVILIGFSVPVLILPDQPVTAVLARQTS